MLQALVLRMMACAPELKSTDRFSSIRGCKRFDPYLLVDTVAVTLYAPNTIFPTSTKLSSSIRPRSEEDKRKYRKTAKTTPWSKSKDRQRKYITFTKYMLRSRSKEQPQRPYAVVQRGPEWVRLGKTTNAVSNTYRCCLTYKMNRSYPRTRTKR